MSVREGYFGEEATRVLDDFSAYDGNRTLVKAIVYAMLEVAASLDRLAER